MICCLNPTSLWGLRQRRAHLYRRLGFGELFLPDAGDFIGYWRLRDWLRLLSFEVESGSFGCYRPAIRSEKWLDRYRLAGRTGDRWWPIFGAVYFLVAVKRVRGMQADRAGVANAARDRDGTRAHGQSGTVGPPAWKNTFEFDRDLHRRSLQRQSRARRLGRAAEVRKHRERAVRRGAAHDQQPDGTDGRDPGLAGAEKALRGDLACGQPVRAQRDDRVASRLEGQGLAHVNQAAGEERSSTTVSIRGSRSSSPVSSTPSELPWRSSISNAPATDSRSKSATLRRSLVTRPEPRASREAANAGRETAAKLATRRRRRAFMAGAGVMSGPILRPGPGACQRQATDCAMAWTRCRCAGMDRREAAPLAARTLRPRRPKNRPGGDRPSA